MRRRSSSLLSCETGGNGVSFSFVAGITFPSTLIPMSAGGAFGGNRGVRPVPPEKGVFPLDHMHLCDQEKKEYISCLKSSGHKSEKCRHLSKMYLQCRMEKNLMAKQDMSELGFRKESDVEALRDGSRNGSLDD
ncbi:uncharacterized protein [Coffea arabica]|uniref:CHCH domain-containing protein n=1 Tax=Coffea arabica TaxID=13443 RepID=A0A6P6XD94_COFAR